MKKKEILVAILLVVLLITIVIKTNIKNDTSSDALKFKKEYESYNDKINENGKKYLNMDIDKNNPIVYATFGEIEDIITSKTGIIYFGFPECPWCRNAVPVLIDAARELGIDKIYYFNALTIRDQKHIDDSGNIIVDKEGTKEYQRLINLLKDYLPIYEGLNDDNIKRLYFPTVVFVKEGKVIGLHTSTIDSQKDPYNGLNNNQYQELKNIYSDYINKTYDILCDQSC